MNLPQKLKEQPKDGVYLSRHGKLKYFYKTPDMWFLEEGIIKQHEWLRVKYEVRMEMSPGWPLEDDFLKNCEYLGEL